MGRGPYPLVNTASMFLAFAMQIRIPIGSKCDQPCVPTSFEPERGGATSEVTAPNHTT